MGKLRSNLYHQWAAVNSAVAITVIVCTHNPRSDYLQRCFDGLIQQSLPKQKWKLLVVDNRSDEPLSGRVDLSWHPAGRLIREEKLGLTPARLRGIRETMGNVLVFVDDDNVLDADFLETVLHIADERPFLGSWSGQCRPEFEIPPPEWSRRYWGNLAVREFDEDLWSNLPRLAETMPCGAGLCVRREVAGHYLSLHESGKRSTQLDRVGNSLMSGGDNDLAACACDLGLGVGLIASLKLTHLIPPERLTEDYIARVAEAIHYCSVLLDDMHGLSRERRGVVGYVADFLRQLRLKQPHRRIAAAACRGRNRALRLVASSRSEPNPSTNVL